MGQVKAVSVSHGPTELINIVDTEGRLWVRQQNGEWVKIQLPDEPEPKVEYPSTKDI